MTTTTATYRVVGTLLATHDARCYTLRMPIADVAHDEVDVDLTVEAPSPDYATREAAWIAANDYATWRWETAPTIEEAQQR